MFSNYTLGRKLFIINTAVALFVQILVAALILFVYESHIQTQFEKRINNQAELIAGVIAPVIVRAEPNSIGQTLYKLPLDNAVYSTYLMTMDGKRLFSSGDPDQSGSTFDSNSLSRGYTASVVVRNNGVGIAILHLSADDYEVSSLTIRATSYTALLLLVSLCLGVALSGRFQHLAVAPILQLSALARQVTERRDYSLRSLVDSKDEVGTLAEDFNTMLDLVSSRDRDLEALVAERTQELEAANAEWRSEAMLRRSVDKHNIELQKRFENAFTNAPIGMAIVAEDMTILQHNSVMSTLFRTSEGLVFNIASISESDSPAVIAGVAKLAKGDIHHFEYGVDCIDSLGDNLHCIFSFSAVRDDCNKFLYSILQVNDITESKRLSTELAYQARHDVLTGLANRRVLEHALLEANQRCIEFSESYIVMLMDLDRFKIVNDSCGHAAGDSLLKQFGALLLSTVRPDDVVARLGGDEFAILLPKCPKKKAGDLAEFIRNDVQMMTFQWDKQTFRIGVSIGVIEINTPQEDVSLVMGKADAACYSAKDGGRNQVFVASQSDKEFVERQGEVQSVRLINDAIDNSDFVLFGQPVVPLQSSIIEADSRIEVLLRVRDRKQGKMLPPGAFFPIAERYGLCAKVDQWVVKTLLASLAVYRDMFDDKRQYWVNLSGQSLSDGNFLTYLETAIKNANLPAGVINFEITETAIISNITDAKIMMMRLKECGCQFALDDFGSGLSSFGYLKQLPVDYIKIDGIFVRDITTDAVDRAFVESIIKIAGTMGIKTVAEFVENQETKKLLQDMGADYGQGYALGRPSELLPVVAISNVNLSLSR